MELVEELLNGLSEVWPAVFAIFLLGYAIACWYYWRELRVLRALVPCWSSALRALSKRTQGWPHSCNRKRGKYSPQSIGHRTTRLMCLILQRKSLPDLNTVSC